jgi:hypothetical protein
MLFYSKKLKKLSLAGNVVNKKRPVSITWCASATGRVHILYQYLLATMKTPLKQTFVCVLYCADVFVMCK